MTSLVSTLLSSSDVVIEASANQKAIQAISIDPAGHRMVTGGIDGVLKYWEFSGMNGVDPKPFRDFIPLEAHAINALSFNTNGNLVLCVSSDSKARIFDREGSTRALEETIKGDPYIRTPENTKGHTHMLSCGQFHPIDPNLFQTGSYDCTVRLWDLSSKRIGMDQNIPHTNVFKCVDARGMCGGKGMFVSSSSYSADGHSILAGCSDGSIQLFTDKIKAGKTSVIARPIHGGQEVSDVQFYGSDQVISRGTDGCVAIWDLRFLRKSEPISILKNLPTNRSCANIALIGSAFVVGTSEGELVGVDGNVIIGRKKLPCRELVRTIYNANLRQIFSTSSDGNVFCMYDQEVSRNGALLFAHRAAPIKKLDESERSKKIDLEIHSYEELIDSGKYKENKRGEIRPVIERKVFVPNAVHVALEQRRFGNMDNTELAEVQRSLLSSSGTADELVSGAYSKTQPKTMLDFSDSHGPVDELLRKKQYCPKCGLKICTCGYMLGKSSGPEMRQSVFPSVSSKKFRHD